MTSSTSYNLNPYHVLQIDDSATFDEVRERHHMLSKTFHPDKQSNNNYDLAKEYFFKIDWAYKALSTPLRRYVYEQFGIQGIEMIEKYPYEFSAYEATIDKIHTQNEVNELVFYLFLVRQVDFQEELTKTESLTYISAADIRKANDLHFGNNLSHTLNFSSTVSEIGQFQNTVELDLENTMDRDAQTIFRFYSSRRLWEGHLNGILITNSFLVWGNGISEELSFSKNLSQSLIIKFSPIVYDQSLQIPKISIQKTFQNDSHLEAETNGSYIIMKLSDDDDKSSRHVNLQFFHSMFNATIGYQRQIDKNCRLLVGTMLSGSTEDVGQGNILLGYYYGVRLITGPQSKIQLKSVFGQHNHLDLRISKGHYNIRIPILCEGVDAVVYELAKLGVILTMYVLHRLISSRVRNTKFRKQKLFDKNYIRLTQDRSKILRLNADALETDRASSTFELKANGLVILKALYGSKAALSPYIKKYNNQNFSPTETDFNRIRMMDDDKFTQNDEEIYDITRIVQSNVIGSQLKDFNPTHLPNPSIQYSETPILYIKYYLRGRILSLQSNLKKPLNIGINESKPANNLISWFLAWINKHVM